MDIGSAIPTPAVSAQPTSNIDLLGGGLDSLVNLEINVMLS